MYIKTREFGYYRNLAKFPSQKLDKVSRDLDLLKGENVFFFLYILFVCYFRINYVQRVLRKEAVAIDLS